MIKVFLNQKNKVVEQALAKPLLNNHETGSFSLKKLFLFLKLHLIQRNLGGRHLISQLYLEHFK